MGYFKPFRKTRIPHTGTVVPSLLALLGDIFPMARRSSTRREFISLLSAVRKWESSSYVVPRSGDRHLSEPGCNTDNGDPQVSERTTKQII
jgi:hypothetical protein